VSTQHESQTYLERYGTAMMGVFGEPGLVLTEGDGCYVTDADGRRYLDLLGGIAVNSLGHGHPALVTAVQEQAARLIHTSNLFTTPGQVALGERLLEIAGAPEGSRVFLCNTGSEANEAAFKLARRTGRPDIVVLEGGFHGRTMGAISLTSKEAYRAPFEPLVPGVRRVPYDDVEALRDAVDESVGAVLVEPIQGEAGVVVPSEGYLEAARRITRDAGALLILDEVQTGIARTGEWFGFQTLAPGLVPDAVTVAKGLGGGVPVGGLITFGPEVSGLLTAGQHGTTFGGNPLACAAALAVLDTIAGDGLLTHVVRRGEHLAARIDALGDARVTGTRGRGLLRAVLLRDAVAPQLVVAAREAGFVVNAPTANAVRLAPPLVISDAELDTFVDALPTLLDRAGEKETS
jgi:acetylornithine aminotransferase